MARASRVKRSEHCAWETFDGDVAMQARIVRAANVNAIPG